VNALVLPPHRPGTVDVAFQPELKGPANVPTAALGAHPERRLLRPVRISLVRISGCSKAAKCLPLSAAP
jgi:hypothetical protein